VGDSVVCRVGVEVEGSGLGSEGGSLECKVWVEVVCTRCGNLACSGGGTFLGIPSCHSLHHSLYPVSGSTWLGVELGSGDGSQGGRVCSVLVVAGSSWWVGGWVGVLGSVVGSVGDSVGCKVWVGVVCTRCGS